MKKATILLLMAIVVSSTAFAHDFINGCNSKGRFKLTCSDFNTAGANFIRVHINTAGVTWANGSKDTVFAQVNAFVIFIPQPNPLSPVSVTFFNQDHAIHGTSQCTHIEEQHTRVTTTCNALSLPLTFLDFKVEKIDNTHARFTVKVADVKDVKQINITASYDNKTYKTIAVLLPDQGSEVKTYSATVKIK